MSLQKPNFSQILIIGAGLAGSDAASFLVDKGIPVKLVECKGIKRGHAQKLETSAELVCTNSLKSLDPNSAHGILKYEMNQLDSLVLRTAKETAVPAGNALAVDRVEFSRKIHQKLQDHPLITFIEHEVSDPIAFAEKHDCSCIILASGPLTTKPLEKWILDNISSDDYYFYDAIAPVVEADSLNMDKMYLKDRYLTPSDSPPDYLNVGLSKIEYNNFIDELISAEKVPIAKFEEPKFFEACLPIDIMAKRGRETPRFSCMKPVGLEDPTGRRPYAVVQLRKENLRGSAYNLVGFQNRLTHREQVRVFKILPGFEKASFLHLGSVHRNSFINSKALLDFDMSVKKYPQIYFAGQITGVEGYTESAAIGLYVAYQVWQKCLGQKRPVSWPADTAIGALVCHLMNTTRPGPTNINFGLFSPALLTLEMRKNRSARKELKRRMIADRAKKCFDLFIERIKTAQII
jgi:methylenetetrahydrofolate--tRNA-(uracil-5-)-methyltransferase